MTSKIETVDQYRTPHNLNVRIDFHERFSTNPYPWFRWVYDHFEITQNSRTLDLGCGPAKLWQENSDRIRNECELVISDSSAEMVKTARQNLAVNPGKIHCVSLECENIPFEENYFDFVFAGHMLYYPVLDRALPEIRRVLKPQGKFYATTNGVRHLKEVDDLITGFRDGPAPIGSVIQNFSLDNGERVLRKYFKVVELDRQVNTLEVDDSESLVAFCLSLTRAGIPKERLAEFVTYVENRMDREDGTIRIGKDSGLFIAN